MTNPYGSYEPEPRLGPLGPLDPLEQHDGQANHAWTSPTDAAGPPAPAGYSYGPPGQPYTTPPSWGHVSGAPGDPGTLDLPWYGIGFGAAVKRAYTKSFRFDGRASRGEYWWFYLFMALVTILGYLVVFAIQALVDQTGGVAALAAVMAVLALALVGALLWTLIALIAIGVRRLHDAGYSGAMYLIAFIPMIGGIMLLVFLASQSKPEGARYDRGVPRW